MMHEDEKGTRAVDVEAAKINADAARMAERIDELQRSFRIMRSLASSRVSSEPDEAEVAKYERAGELAEHMQAAADTIRTAASELQATAPELQSVLAGTALRL